MSLRLRHAAPDDVWNIIVHARSVSVVESTGGVALTALQEEGALRALRILTRYGGVLVADSVGMGKTYIGVRLIELAGGPPHTVTVVVPATLRTKWRRTLGPTLADVRVVTHTSLSRHAATRNEYSVASNGQSLIVVDEAHQFRNPRTARYRALSRLSTQARVVLLSATPINNRLSDLYWLLRLFLGNGDLRDTGVPDLRSALQTDGSAFSLTAARVVSQVVVRRTRADLPRDHAGARVGFPRRKKPVPISYDLEHCYPDVHRALHAISEELRFAPFRMSVYAPELHTQDAHALVRIGLVKRLESSICAWRSSLMRLLRFTELSAETVRTGGYLQARDVGRGDPVQLALTALLARPLPESVDRARLLHDIECDAVLLQELIASTPPGTEDPKATVLQHLIQDLGDSPRVIFTQYKETAEHLFNTLGFHQSALLHGSRAAIASGVISRRAVLEQFAPVAMRGSVPRAHERILTLISTDVLAEGLDLQDAQHCISYDLPWNPVRLMQRIGRIDRMHSPHAYICPWYFVPGSAVDDMLELLRRLRRKMKTIESTVGREPPILVRKRNSSTTHGRPALRDVFGELRSLATAPKTSSDRCIPVSYFQFSSAERRSAVFAMESGECRWWEGFVEQSHGPARALTEREIAALLLDVHCEGLPGGCNSAETRQAATWALTERRRSQCREESRNDVCRAASTALLAALRRTPGGATQRMCDAAEKLLRRLRGGLPVAQERELAAALRTARRVDAYELVPRIERIIGGSNRAAARPRIVAILVIQGTGPG